MCHHDTYRTEALKRDAQSNNQAGRTLAALEMGRASVASDMLDLEGTGASLLAATESMEGCVSSLLWLEEARLRAESAASLLLRQHPP